MQEKVEFIKVNETYSKIKCDISLLYELIDDFSKYVNGYKFMPAYKKGHWDGKIRYIQQNGFFYNGLLKDVWEKCKQKGYNIFEFTNYDKTSEYTEQSISERLEKFIFEFDLYHHQLEAITESLTKKKRIILSATSSGKSGMVYSISRILAEDYKKTLIIVPSVMLVNQLYSDFEDYSKNDDGFNTKELVHKVFAGKSKNTDLPITLSTWQSISALKEKKDTTRLKEFMEQFDAVIIDETHKATANELKLILESAINAKYRIGLTGTLDEVKSSMESLIGLIGKPHKVLSTREMIDKGMATDVKIYPCVLSYSDIDRESVTKEIAKNYKSKAKGMSSAYQYEIDYIISNKKRNEFIAKMVKNMKGNSIILTRYIQNHAIPLAETIRKYTDKTVIVLDKDTPADIREETRKDLETLDDIVVIATTALMGTGISIKNLRNIMFSCPQKSKIPVLQSIGRVLRLHKNKERAYVFDIVDDMGYNGYETYAMKHFKNRFEYYNQEDFEIEIKQFNL